MPERHRRFIVTLVVLATVGAGALYGDVISPLIEDGAPSDTRPESTRQDAPQTPPESTRLASAALQTLPVKGRAPKTGYSRDQFGEGWGSLNGCSTREVILRRDLNSVRLDADGCEVVSGTLSDPYTGKTIAFRRGAGTSDDVQIDHVVALSDAWQKGAQQLSAGQREAFANDPLNLLAVDGPVNQQKGDGDAATWLPPNRAYRCRYVARQIAVKVKYTLWVTKAEQSAMSNILKTCSEQVLPVVGATDRAPGL